MKLFYLLALALFINVALSMRDFEPGSSPEIADVPETPSSTDLLTVKDLKRTKLRLLKDYEDIFVTQKVSDDARKQWYLAQRNLINQFIAGVEAGTSQPRRFMLSQFIDGKKYFTKEKAQLRRIAATKLLQKARENRNNADVMKYSAQAMQMKQVLDDIPMGKFTELT